MSLDTHGQSLSAIDSSFLRVESDQAHMHIGWSAVFAVPPGGERPTIDALRARAATRLHWVPRCRQRVARSAAGPLGEPRWIDDARFDLREHIVGLTGPAEAVSRESFARMRDAVLSEPLDRARPLWQVVLVPRLEDGRVGIIGRVHHALADGTAALVIATLLLDGDGDDDDPAGDGAAAAPTWRPRAAPGALRWATDAANGAAGLTRGVLREGVRAARRPRAGLGAALRDATRVAHAVREDLLPAAPGSALNVPNGPRRTLVGCQMPLDELRAAKARSGGTLNDIALAMVAGALRGLALRQGEAPAALKAMIPVSVRRPHEYAELGNRISQVMVWLPLDLDTPHARLDAVRAQTERFKRTGRPQGHQTLLGGLGLLRGPARDALLHFAAAPRTYNLTLSNVRGPSTALQLFGARLEELYPVVPIGHGHALAIGMVSHDEHLHFGLHADPDALPEVGELPELLAAELRALAGHEGRNGTAPRPLTRRRGQLVIV